MNSHGHQLRIRYSETDAMGTYYNSRALEWFECGRTELCRALGKPYSQWDRLGVAVPLVTAHVEFRGKAKYDDLIELTTTVSVAGRARLRFDVEVRQAESKEPVCTGYTVHAITDLNGKPIRPPQWLLELIGV
jgi:acyl-CoA thioester hydrolase